MLPANYRLIIHNKTGVSLDFSANAANESCDVTYKRWSWSSDGSLNRESTEQSGSASTDLADGGTEVLDTVSGESFIGAHGTFFIETDNASAIGDVVLGLEHSTDGGTTWPSDSTDFDPDVDLIPLATITLAGAETQRTNWAA